MSKQEEDLIEAQKAVIKARAYQDGYNKGARNSMITQLITTAAVIIYLAIKNYLIP